MNRSDKDARANILALLCEGNSLRSTSRLTGASINTVTKLLVEVGESATWFQDQYLTGLRLDELQLDEIWAFVGAKEANKDAALNEHMGDCWTWTALCPRTKLIASWHVGRRDEEDAKDFCHDLAKRVASGAVQISTDGLMSYRYAVPFAFHGEPDLMFGQLVKRYGKDEKGNDVVIRADKIPLIGQCDVNKISTSLVERHNLTIRMSCRRFTRKTNAFSKKFENHCAALGLHFFYYNFIRKHMTLKTTPAVAAGIVDDPWKLNDLIEMHDAYWNRFHPVNRPKSYRKRSDDEDNSN